jgi:hypothetical protein
LLYFRNDDDQLEFPANGAPHLLFGGKTDITRTCRHVAY